MANDDEQLNQLRGINAIACQPEEVAAQFPLPSSRWGLSSRPSARCRKPGRRDVYEDPFFVLFSR